MVKNILNERSQRLLKILVDHYIREGQPVSSKALAETFGSTLSPASIRNVMADLEEKGYIRSPHTSAGRIPTALGYRFFVDSLLTVKALDKQAVRQCQQQLNTDQDIQGLVNSASALLANITQLAGLVTIPKREQLILRQVEFLPLAANRILVILVLNAQEVQNRIIYTDNTYSKSALQQAANYLNDTFAGHDLTAIRQKLLDEMQADRQQLDGLMRMTIEMADKALVSPETKPDYVMAGHNHLLDLADGGGVVKLRQLFDAFNEKRDILYLLDNCLNAQGVQIYIGQESGFDILDDCSLITSTYSVAGQVVGALGVIGPTRMAYDRVIPIVDLTAKLLSAALNQTIP